jgi:hypothetical protein
MLIYVLIVLVAFITALLINRLVGFYSTHVSADHRRGTVTSAHGHRRKSAAPKKAVTHARPLRRLSVVKKPWGW